MNIFVARARTYVGSPFRFQGRESESGFDCVGLIVEVFALERDAIPSDYDWRERRADMEALAERFFDVGHGVLEAGDVLLVRTGRGRRHLAIWTGNGIVHADAVQGRVVERPGDVPWPMEAVWRRRRNDEERTATWRP